ncbi:MAG: glycosyltransferase family 39 protein [Parcubacteria group bacterium]|jgi:4-amino-4-deoxy-L-arabinose transferase-like glycosyltransferase
MLILNNLADYFHNKIVFAILVNFVLLVVLLAINRKYLKEVFLKINKITWISLVVVFLGALFLRMYLPVHSHILYIDEFWYMEAGKNILFHGSQDYYPKFIGWPFILSIAFGIFGVSNWVAINTSIFFGALSIFAVFFTVFLITEDAPAALLSSALFSLLPIHIRWSATAETNVTSLFFILLTVFLCFLYFEYKEESLLWLAFSSIAFTSQIRSENYFLFPLFIITFLIYGRDILKRINLRFLLPIFIFAAISLPNFIQSINFQMATNWISNDTQGYEAGSNWSLANLLHNSLAYGVDLFNGRYYPAVLLLFIISGFIYLFYKKRKAWLFLMIWFISFWLIYFTSWFQTLGARERFYLSFYPIIIIFIVYGIFFISQVLSFKKKWIDMGVRTFLFAVIIFLFIPYIQAYAKMYSDDAHVLEANLPELAGKNIPANCTIVANLPTILRSTTNLSFVDADLFLKNDEVQKDVLGFDCALFLEDYTCSGWDQQSFTNCKEIKSRFLLKEYQSYSKGRIRYKFYNISEK